MVAERVSLGRDATDDPRMKRRLASDQEEGRPHPARAQQIEEPRRDHRMRPVVEGEGDDRILPLEPRAVRSEHPAARVDDAPGDGGVKQQAGRDHSRRHRGNSQEDGEERRVDQKAEDGERLHDARRRTTRRLKAR